MKIKTEQHSFLVSTTITLTADDFKDKETTNVTHGRITDIGRSLVDAKKEVLKRFEQVQSDDSVDFQITVIRNEQLKEVIDSPTDDLKFAVIKAMKETTTGLSLIETRDIVRDSFEKNGLVSWTVKTTEGLKHAIEVLNNYHVKYKL